MERTAADVQRAARPKEDRQGWRKKKKRETAPKERTKQPRKKRRRKKGIEKKKKNWKKGKELPVARHSSREKRMSRAGNNLGSACPARVAERTGTRRKREEKRKKKKRKVREKGKLGRNETRPVNVDVVCVWAFRKGGTGGSCSLFQKPAASGTARRDLPAGVFFFHITWK